MRLLSTRVLADALGVSESSLKRWVDSGRISASRTEGGHRRIPLSEAIRFIRDTRAPISRPELLDLQEVAVARSRGEDRLASYVRDGDSVAARGWLIARYLEGATIAELADGPIREAMVGLGELWYHDQRGIFIEHRGTDVCLQAVAQLRGMIPTVPATAPVALGGAPPGDPYLVPTQLAAMVVAEAGMTPVNLGPDTPVDAFARAVDEHQPKLVWISISAELASANACAISNWLETVPATTAIVIGGTQSRVLSNLPVRAVRATSMGDLASVAGSLVKGKGAS